MPSDDTRNGRSELGPLQEASLFQNASAPKRVRGSRSQASLVSESRRIQRSPNENINNSIAEEDASMSAASTDDEDEEECQIAGRLVSVELEDFMCHKHLVVRFDEKRNCTYIGGSNGSGKSALFAAINLGLGGRGRANDRGGSAAAYIREGMNKARIIIILTNEGIGKHPKYADQISIRRIIGQKSSSYELRSRCSTMDKEDFVSKRKGDLDDICRRFNIDLENPIVWMSQDRSRQFLQDLQPKKLFNMFMESSKIGNCYQQGAEARVEIDDIQVKLDDCKEILKNMSAEYSTSKKRLDATRRIAQKTAELNLIELQMSWLPVKENKEKISACEDEVSQLESKIEELKRKKDTYSRELEGLQVNLDATLVSEDTVNRKRELEEFLHAKNGENRDLLKQKEELKDEWERLRRSEANAARNCELLKRQLDEMKGIDYEEQKEKEQQMKSELKKISQEEEHLRSRQPRAQEDLRNMQLNYEQVDREFKNLKAELKNFKEGMDEIEREKRRMEDIRRDQESRFGRDIPRIKQVISQNAHMFEKPPIGPVGSFISVTDSKWVHVVEYVLKRQMGTFLVSSGRDRKTFFDLLDRNRINYKPPVVCQRFHDARLNIQRFEPHAEFLTVLRVVHVSDDNVFNNLVEDCGAASVLLVETDEEARRLMSTSPPSNAAKAITLRFGEAFPVSESRPYRFYSNSPYQAQFLNSRGSLHNHQRDYDAEMHELRTRHSTTQHQLQEVSRQHQEVYARVKNVEKENRELAAKRDRLTERRESILPQLDRLTTQVDVEMLAQSEQELNDCKERLNRHRAEMHALKEKLLSNSNDMKQVQEEAKALSAEMSDLRKQENTVERRRETQRKEINERMKKAGVCDQRIAECENRHSSKEREIQKLREVIARKQAELQQLSTYQPDLGIMSSRNDLEDAERKLKEQIRKYEAALGGPQETAEMVAEKKAELTTMRMKVVDYENIWVELRALFFDRYKQLQALVAQLTYKLQLTFTRQLALRNYSGTLDVDYRNRTLSVHVQTHKHYDNHSNSPRSQKKTQDLRGLSGGERSYSTASFVVALWECIESPFRLLDEFDVFMDMINRRVVMDMLVYVATMKYNAYQFLFFTPQGIQDLQEKQKVLIYKMPQVRP